MGNGTCRLDPKNTKFNNSKVKKSQIFLKGAKNLQAQLKILKKLSEYRINQPERKFFQKFTCELPAGP
jgi:hypothetical protein